MKNVESLQWTQEKDRFILRNDQEMLVELVEENFTKATFMYDSKSYSIRNQGFWNPVTVIECEGKQVLALKRHFLTSKAIIEFVSGETFSCKVRNSPLVKMSFFSAEQVEILNYKLQTSLNPNSVRSVMQIYPNTVPDRELLLLIVLGFYSFLGVAMENNNADFIIIAAGA